MEGSEEVVAEEFEEPHPLDQNEWDVPTAIQNLDMMIKLTERAMKRTPRFIDEYNQHPMQGCLNIFNGCRDAALKRYGEVMWKDAKTGLQQRLK